MMIFGILEKIRINDFSIDYILLINLIFIWKVSWNRASERFRLEF